MASRGLYQDPDVKSLGRGTHWWTGESAGVLGNVVSRREDRVANDVVSVGWDGGGSLHTSREKLSVDMLAAS